MAMAMPFMLLLILGMSEVSTAFNTLRKVQRISNSVTDLTAQAQIVTPAELDNLLDVGAKILEPYPDTNLTTVIASVTFDEDGDPSVDWSYDGSGGQPWPSGSEPPIELPGTVAQPESSIVVGFTTLDYEPMFTGTFSAFKDTASIELNDVYYLRPRLTGTVTCPDC